MEQDRTSTMLKNIVIILGVLIFIAAGLLIYGVVKQMSKGDLAPHVRQGVSSSQGDHESDVSLAPDSSVSLRDVKQFHIALPKGDVIKEVRRMPSVDAGLMIFTGNQQGVRHILIMSYKTGVVMRTIDFE